MVFAKKQTATATKSFYEICNDTTKRYCIEAFSFTHQYGLNIYFDDYDDLIEMLDDVEIEFWHFIDSYNDIELEVRDFEDLKRTIDFIEEENCTADEIDAYASLVENRFCDWDNVVDWYADNFVCDFVSYVDFGYYLIEELGYIEIPECIQPYFDYEAYGRDALMQDYTVHDGKIYRNC